MIYVLDLCEEVPIKGVPKDSAAAYWARLHGAAFETQTAAEVALGRLAYLLGAAEEVDRDA